MNPAVIDDMSWAMAEVYGAVTDRILINLAHHFKYVQAKGEITGSFEYQAKMLAQMGQVNKETIAIMAQSLGGADDALKAALETAIFEALKTEEPKLRKAAEKGLLLGGVPELSLNQLQAFSTYYTQAADKLNLVNTVMLESTQNAYMATVSDVVQKINRSQSILNTATGEVVTGVSSWNQALHGAVQKMVSNGLTGFIDHGGHKWSPEAYVAMDIRTTMFNTSRAAIWERSEQYGNDLYQVSSHQGARPLCYPWQGKVISKYGVTGTAKDLDGNKIPVHSEDEIESFRYGGGLFGVNCGHYPMVFIDGVSTLKGEPQDPEDNAKTYAESQQQRALERKLREEKRDLEVMKAQGASPQEIAAQKERVRNASADIDQFCDDTGRTRKRNRETAPVRATWHTPDGDITRFNGGYIGTDVVPPPKGQIRQIPQTDATGGNVARQATKPTPFVMQYGTVFDDKGYRKPQLAQFADAKATLDKAPRNVKEAWSRVSAELQPPEFGNDGGSDAYYSQYSNRTHFKTYKKAFDESTYQRKNTCFFHEYGHNIDRKLASNGGWLSTKYKNASGESLYDVMQRECAKNVREFYLSQKGIADAYEVVKIAQNSPGGMGFGSYIRQALRQVMPGDEYRAIRGMLIDAGENDEILRPLAEKWLKGKLDSDMMPSVYADHDIGLRFAGWVKSNYTVYQRADVSDMYEHFMVRHFGITFPFGIGHGKSYALDPENAPIEAFAEMYSATVTQNDSLSTIKDFFPESYAMFEEMLRSVQ